MMRFKLICFLFLVSLNSQAILIESNTLNKRLWQKTTSDFFNISFKDDIKQLKLIDQKISECKGNDCKTKLKHFYGYLFYSNKLRKNRNLTKELKDLTLRQHRYLNQCQNDECINKKLDYFCDLEESGAVFLKEFCVSNFVINNFLIKK